MSDSYQPIYDAVRSRISNGDIGSAVETAIRDLNLSHYAHMIQVAAEIVGSEAMRPSVLYRPIISQDGAAWLAILGDLSTGVVGCGDTPAEAMADFDRAFQAKAIAPIAGAA